MCIQERLRLDAQLIREQYLHKPFPKNMDTDAEYKALSALAETLEMFYNFQIEGKLYLYSERNPCESCQGVIKQFQQKFPYLEITVFWDHPYPPLS